MDENVDDTARLAAALDALSTALNDPKFRREFSEAPPQALQRAGINVAAIPDDFLAAIAELSTTELRLIADILRRVRASLPVPISGVL